MEEKRKEIKFFEELTDELRQQTENLLGMRFEEQDEKTFIRESPRDLNHEFEKTSKVSKINKLANSFDSPGILPDIPFQSQKGIFDMSSAVARDLQYKMPANFSKLDKISGDLQEKGGELKELEELEELNAPLENKNNHEINLRKVKESFNIPKKIGLGFINKDNKFYKGIKDNVELGFEPEVGEVLHREIGDISKLREIKEKVISIEKNKTKDVDKFIDYSKFKEAFNLLEQIGRLVNGSKIHVYLDHLKSSQEKIDMLSQKSLLDEDEIVKAFAKIDKLLFSKV